jgi:universal stress protein E
MSMSTVWKRIVVAISDPGKPSGALKKAAEIAGRTGAGLCLFHAYAPAPGLASTFDPRIANLIISESLARQREQLERLARPWRRRGIDVRTELAWDSPPYEAIVRYVLKQKADLLVADSRRHMRLARWFLTNTDWELIRHCPCPLWFVKSPARLQKVRVLAAVDPFHTRAKPARLDERILQTARQVATLFRGKLAMCHAYIVPEYTMSDALGNLPARMPLPVEQLRRYEGAVRKAVDQLARRHRIPRAARFVERGDPAAVLPQLARRLSSDVLVMGAVSRSGVSRLLIGSTAEQVIGAVNNSDILIVKPASFRAAVPRRARTQAIPVP